MHIKKRVSVHCFVSAFCVTIHTFPQELFINGISLTKDENVAQKSFDCMMCTRILITLLTLVSSFNSGLAKNAWAL